MSKELDRMNKKIIVAVCVLIGILLLFGISKGCQSCSQKKIAGLSEQIETLKEDFVPMQFEIVKNAGSRIKVKVAFCDIVTEKKVSKAKTFDLEGEELNVDFQVIELDGKNFVFFPCGLYSDKIPLAESLPLFDLYDQKGFPAIYGGIVESNPSKSERVSLEKELTTYFDLVKSGETSLSKEQYGTAVHELKNISRFKKGFVYNVLCHPHTGGIEIVKAD